MNDDNPNPGLSISLNLIGWFMCITQNLLLVWRMLSVGLNKKECRVYTMFNLFNDI